MQGFQHAHHLVRRVAAVQVVDVQDDPVDAWKLGIGLPRARGGHQLGEPREVTVDHGDEPEILLVVGAFRAVPDELAEARLRRRFP